MRDSEELLRLVHTAMVGADVDQDAIYAQLEYTADKLAAPEHRTRHELQKWFWATAEQVTGDPEIGLTLCPHLPAFRGDAMEYIFLSSPTLADGLAAVLDYRRLVSDAFHMNLVRDAAGNRIVLAGTSNDAAALRHSEICFCYGFIKTMRRVTNERFQPSAVTLCAPARADAAAYEAVFGCPVSFDGAESEIWVSDEVLAIRSPHYNPAMLSIHRAIADDQLADIRRQDIVEDIRLCLFQALGRGDSESGGASLEAVAEELSMTARHLRFELDEAGVTFRDILRRARFALARRLLWGTDATMEQIAAYTGFSQRSAFCRAFADWADISPSRYRVRHRAPPHARCTAEQILQDLARIGSGKHA